MELTIIDRLLVCLVERTRPVPDAMRAAGYTETEISEAWREARRADYTESTGLSMDRLTAAGRARGEEIRSLHGRP